MKRLHMNPEKEVGVVELRTPLGLRAMPDIIRHSLPVAIDREPNP